MNTLYININGDDIKDTENMTVVGKPEDAIINKFYFQLVNGIVKGVAVPGIGEVKKKSLVTDFETNNAKAFAKITEQWDLVKQALLGENPDVTFKMTLPQEYVEWLYNHSDSRYNKVAESLASRGNAVEINVGNIYRNGILLLVNNIETDKKYGQFVVSDALVDDDSAIAVAIRKRIGEDVPIVKYEGFDGFTNGRGTIGNENDDTGQGAEAESPTQDKSIAFLTFKNIENSCETIEWEYEDCPVCGWMGLLDLGNDTIVCENEDCGHRLDEDEIDAIREEFDQSHEYDNGLSKMELFDFNRNPICNAIEVPNPRDNWSHLPYCHYNPMIDGHDLVQVANSPWYMDCKYYNVTNNGITSDNDLISRSINVDNSSPFRRNNKRRDPSNKYDILFDVVEKQTGRIIIHNVRDLDFGDDYDRLSGMDSDSFFHLVGDGLWSVSHDDHGLVRTYIFSHESAYLLPFEESIYESSFGTKEDSQLLKIGLPYANRRRIITVGTVDDGAVRIRKTNDGTELFKGNYERVLFKHPYQYGKALAIKVENGRNELVYFDDNGQSHLINIESAMLRNDPYEIDCYMVSENRFVFRPMEDSFQYLYSIEGQRIFKCDSFDFDLGCLDLNDKTTLFSKFETGRMFNGALVFHENWKEGVVDLDGKIILPAEFDSIHLIC